jgi:hypothetical protein
VAWVDDTQLCKSSQTKHLVCNGQRGECGLVANGKAKAIRESWESAVTDFSASCKQFPLKVVIFVSN